MIKVKLLSHQPRCLELSGLLTWMQYLDVYANVAARVQAEYEVRVYRRASDNLIEAKLLLQVESV